MREHYEHMEKRERMWQYMVEKIFECDFWKDPTKNNVRNLEFKSYTKTMRRI